VFSEGMCARGDVFSEGIFLVMGCVPREGVFGKWMCLVRGFV